MDTYLLEELSIKHLGITTKLNYTTAQLVVVTDTGYRLWYIDVDGITQTSLLHMFNESEDIRIDLTGLTARGTVLRSCWLFSSQRHASRCSHSRRW